MSKYSKPSKNFIIAAGGTGMRCLQSFLNTCALGMMSGETIDILLLETDIENGDKKNSENLVNWYRTLCGNSKDGKFDYFGSNINFYIFIPDYSKDNQRRFTLISRLEEGNSEVNRMLTDLFYEEGVQEFDLMHGFRAQTHVGSYLMYHAFIDEIRNAVASDQVRNKSQLYKFVNNIKEQNTAGEARIFLLGSTFGGTGASSIPVMARAISDSAKVITGGAIQMENMYFGAVILTPYFTFKPPSKEHKKAEKVIADSQFFFHNSAAAMMYYIKDNTILTTYKRFYMLGWPFSSINVDDYKAMLSGDGGGKTITGGKSQENPAHPLELIGAFAARHFLIDTTKEWFKETIKTEVKFKAIEFESGSNGDKVAFINFDDLIEGEFNLSDDENQNNNDKKSSAKGKLEDVLCWNFTGMYYLAILVQQLYKGSISNLLLNLKRYNYEYIFTDEEIEAFNYYCQYLTYTKTDESLKPGWIPQMWYSMNKPSKGEFLGFSPDVMSVFETKGDVNRSQLIWRGEEGKSLSFEADRVLSTWFKINKPIKKGTKIEFFDHFKKSISNLYLISNKNN